MIVEVKKRAKKAKIKAKKDFLAMQKSYTGNNSPKITPKKRKSQPKWCVDCGIFKKKGLKKRKYKAMECVLAMQK